jgi:hypothetical protein
MQVLITGGTGFIGRALCTQLFHSGHTVTVLTRSSASAPADLTGVRLVESLAGLKGIDAVVNLAGENLSAGRWSAARKQEFRRSRLETTQKLLAWMAETAQRPQVLISGSAIGYYGARGDEPLDESSARGSDFAATLCGDWEAEANKARALGVRVCIVRIGIVLGAEGGALAKMLPPFKLGLGGPMGSGAQTMSWIRRNDLVRMIQWLLETPGTMGPYNGTAPAPVSNAEFSKALGAALKRPAMMPMPAIMLRLMVGEFAELLLTGQRVLPVRAEAQGFEFRYPTLALALRDLSKNTG